MTSGPRFDEARTISCDFDGVLSSLVLGRQWEKTRARAKTVPVVSSLAHGLKVFLDSLTKGLRRPLPDAEPALRRLRASERRLFVLSSRTGGRIPAAKRWLAGRAWTDIFEQVFFNDRGEGADEYKARILGSRAIDVHIDDDAETVACLARRFPEKLFIHMNYYRRESPEAANIIMVREWPEVPAVFSLRDGE